MDLLYWQEAVTPEGGEILDDLEIRLLGATDPEKISEACRQVGWGKSVAQYQKYLVEQTAGTRICFVAAVGNVFAGYVTVNWAPPYPAFAEQNIPEIQDLNVLPQFRNRGIASRLLDRAEHEVGRRCSVVGIGVGLHPGYGSAQRLYAKRGYIPDGRGVWQRDHIVQEGIAAVFNDDLVLHLTKRLD
jgi:GNAT superfamily N-acetyltransferase